MKTSTGTSNECEYLNDVFYKLLRTNNITKDVYKIVEADLEQEYQGK